MSTARLLERVLREALATLDLRALVREALPPPPRGMPVRLIAVGKGASAMARGALDAWGDVIERGVVVCPDHIDVSRVAREARVVVMHAGHPLPDARSVKAASACMSLVARSGRCHVLSLISGGASALVALPSENVTLAQKRAVARVLLRSGARVQDINVVRKHLSRIKGGGLARAAAPNRVLTLVASDVIDGRANEIGSGPTFADDTSVVDARRVLRRYAPEVAGLPLVDTLHSSDPQARRLRGRIVVSPEHLVRAVVRALRERGFRARGLPSSQADVFVMAEEYAALAKRLAPATALVRAAEPSVCVDAKAGRGGRSTHLATLVGVRLPAGVTFMAAATDGVDGSGGTAGAVVDGSFVQRVGGRWERSLARFDTGALHRAAGTALSEGATGHNLADLHVLLAPRA